ncbi:restriction endonuclease subunit S [Vibrio parahaemolyticus]|nr:restriction endonuclease subunit S [Vibrio parahaemolyticus]
MSELVPEGWTFQPIGDYVEKMVGGAPLKPSDFSTAGHRVIPKKAVQFGGKIKFDVETYCSSDFAENNIKNVVDSQYLITTLRDLVPSGPTIGVIGVLEEKGPFVLAQGVYGLKTNNISDEYLAQVSNTSWYRNEMRKVFVGSTQVHIRNQEFLDVKVPFPPLPEQKKIAAILISVDDVIEKTQAQIDKLKDLKTAMMQELLTRGVGVDGKPHTEFKDSPVGRIPKGWDVVTTGSIAKSIVPGRNKPKQMNGNIPWLTIADLGDVYVDKSKSRRGVTREVLSEAKGKTLPKNTVIMSVVGEFGLSSIAARELVINQQLHGFVCGNKVDPTFLCLSLRYHKDQMEKLATQTTIAYMNKDNAESVVLALPSLSEQRKIASVIISIEEKVKSVSKTLHAKTLVKKALMQDLLIGRVRVKVED